MSSEDEAELETAANYTAAESVRHFLRWCVLLPMRGKHLSWLGLCGILCCACGQQSAPKRGLPPSPPVRPGTDPDRLQQTAHQQNVVGDAPQIFLARNFRSHPISVGTIPEWVLFQEVAEPLFHKNIQHQTPHGCTITGQMALELGEPTKRAQWVTLVTSKDVLPVMLDEIVPLGVTNWRGKTTWYNASQLPASFAIKPEKAIPFAFLGRIDGLSVLGETHQERLTDGTFSARCGEMPEVQTLFPSADPDGHLSCFGDEGNILTFQDRAAKSAYPSYRSFLLFDGETTKLDGRFVRLLKHASNYWVVVNLSDNTYAVHELSLD